MNCAALCCSSHPCQFYRGFYTFTDRACHYHQLFGCHSQNMAMAITHTHTHSHSSTHADSDMYTSCSNLICPFLTQSVWHSTGVHVLSRSAGGLLSGGHLSAHGRHQDPPAHLLPRGAPPPQPHLRQGEPLGLGLGPDTKTPSQPANQAAISPVGKMEVQGTTFRRRKWIMVTKGLMFEWTQHRLSDIKP